MQEDRYRDRLDPQKRIDERLSRVRQYQQSQQARNILREQEGQQERNPFDIQQQTRLPEEKQEKEGWFSKTLNALTFLGDVGMGIVTTELPFEPLGIYEETDKQVKRGGSATDIPVNIRQRSRRAELLGINPQDPWGTVKFGKDPRNWWDYAKATRKAYIEAREDKEYEFGVPFAGEVLFDATTYVPFGILAKVAKPFKGTTTALKNTKSVRKLNKTITVTDPVTNKTTRIKNPAFTDDADFKHYAESLSKDGVFKIDEKEMLDYLDKGRWQKTQKLLSEFDNKLPTKGFFGWLSDKTLGKTIRYNFLNPLNKGLIRYQVRDGLSNRLAQKQALEFNWSARTAGIIDPATGKVTEKSMDEIFHGTQDAFFDAQGFSDVLYVNGKKLTKESLKDINEKALKEYRVAPKNGKLNHFDFISSFYTKSLREIMEDSVEVFGKRLYVEDLYKKAEGRDFLRRYTRFDGISDDVLVGVTHALKDLDVERFALHRLGLNVSHIMPDTKNANKVKEFLGTKGGKQFMDQIYFPRAIIPLKHHEKMLQNIWEVKTKQKRLRKLEPLQTPRKATSETINQHIINNNMQLHKISTTLTLHRKQVSTIMNEEIMRKELGGQIAGINAYKGVTVLSDVELDALGGIMKKTGKTPRKFVTSKKIESLKEKTPFLYRLLSKEIEGSRVPVERIQELIGRRIVTSADDSLNSLSDFHRLAGKEKIDPRKFRNIFFKNEQDALNFIKHFDLQEAGLWRKAANNLSEANAIFRTVGTGFDFSWHMLQGLVTLGAATTVNPKLFVVYGQSMKNAALAMVNPENSKLMLRQMKAENPQILDRALTRGNIAPQQEITDVFAGTDTISEATDALLKRLKINPDNGYLSKSVNNILRIPAGAAIRAQAAFNIAGDTVKFKGYETLLPWVESQSKRIAQATNRSLDDVLLENERHLGSFLMKATGGIDQYALGLPASQQAVERAFLFFSPSYTRASLGLIASVVSGDLEGRLARRSLMGMAMLGTTIYVATATALAQEPKLDPRRGDFMSVKIGDSDVGVGGFYRGFLSFITRFADKTFTDETMFEEDQTHPFVSYIRGRTSPTTSLGWDIFTGSNYIGEPIEKSFAGYGETVGKRFLPFWAENTFVTDPLTGNYQWTDPNILGTSAELLGLRAIPLDVYDERKRVRDESAQEYYGKKWADLNRVQRTVLNRDSEYLSKLETEAKRLSAFRGDVLQKQLNEYYKESKKIVDDYDSKVEEGVRLIDEGVLDVAGFREIYLSEAGRDYYLRRSKLREETETGDLKQVGLYWTQIAGDKEKKRNIDFQDDVLDVAFQDYMNTVVLNPEIQTEAGETDWYARDIAISDFQTRWEDKGLTDILNYVKARTYVARDFPPLVAEFHAAKDHFSFYWKESEKEALKSYSNPDAMAYKEWKLESNQTEKALMLERFPSIKRINSDISAIRKGLRQIDQGLDGFLFRWGYTTTLANSQNKKKQNLWRYPIPFTLEEYQSNM